MDNLFLSFAIIHPTSVMCLGDQGDPQVILSDLTVVQQTIFGRLIELAQLLPTCKLFAPTPCKSLRLYSCGN